jgi:AbrB family looped-hinge helix DNA binding protein
MKQFVATMTTRGRITIPAEVRRHLGVSTPGKVTWLLADDGTIELRAVRPISEWPGGVIPALVDTESLNSDDSVN